MSSFEFVTVLIAVIVGLGVSHLLTGLGRAIHLRDRAPLWWVHLCWTATVFLYLSLQWWVLFSLNDDSVWNFGVYLYILFHSVLMFMLAILLYRPDPDEALDLRATFETNRSWFLGIFALALIVDLGTTAIQGNLWNPWYYPIGAIFAAILAIAGTFVRNPRYHEFLALYFLAVFLGWGVIARWLLPGAV